MALEEGGQNSGGAVGPVGFPEQHFRFRHAWDGWYYIIVQHSEKTLAQTGEQLEQYGRQSTPLLSDDVCQFRFVPEGESLDNITNRQFIADPYGEMRSIILAAVSNIPKAGGALGGLLGFLWPEDDLGMRVWNQIKEYVISVVRELILQDNLKQLEDKLNGIRRQLETYQNEVYGSRPKQGALDTLLGLLNFSKGSFLSLDEPEWQLPFFVALGTLRLAALREQYLNYERIYNEKDPRPKERLADLQKEIRTFQKAAENAREKVLSRRAEKVRVAHDSLMNMGVTAYKWWVVDDYDGWQSANRYSEIQPSHEGEWKARRVLERRKQAVRSELDAELDYLLAPARLWKYLDRSEQTWAASSEREIRHEPFGHHDGQEFEDKPYNQPISRILMYTTGIVEGVEIFYGTSGGLHGSRIGTAHCIDLAGWEKVVSVWGRLQRVGQWLYLESVYFETNRGQVIGGGGSSGFEWMASPSDYLNPMLYRIGGRVSNFWGDGSRRSPFLEALSFFWAYSRID